MSELNPGSIRINPKDQPPTSNSEMSTPAMGSLSGTVADQQIDNPDVAISVRGNMSEAPVEAATLVPSERDMWFERSKTAYEQSTSYFDTNVKGDLDNSIKAFHNKHPSDSPYAQSENPYTSKYYRPKTRTIMNKYEAACAAAFFSNNDIISIEAENPADKKECLAADLTKHLTQYRLTKFMKWYVFIQASFQDSMSQGQVCAHYYWKVKKGSKTTMAAHPVTGHTAEQTNMVFLVDKPCVDLVPLENIRFSPAADWMDPVGTSPYFIRIHKMTVADIRNLIKAGKFNDIGEANIRAGYVNLATSTKQARQGGHQDPMQEVNSTIQDYEYVYIYEHFHIVDEKQMVWFTVGNIAMLSNPVPVRDAYPHCTEEDRPFVIGTHNIESHNIFPASMPTLLRPLQDETNELANQFLNNVKLVMNKKYIIKSDAAVDYKAIGRNQPGSFVFSENPKEDVFPLEVGDVTQSAGNAQDRVNVDIDELMGNFSASNNMTSRKVGETARGMQMLNSNANMLVEYTIRTFGTTYVEVLLRKIVKMLRVYENDKTILKIAGDNAKLFEKYGVSEVSDDMLDKDLTIKINVGLNATDPNIKMSKLIAAITAIAQLSSNPGKEGFDMGEISKELYGLAGYGDGMRFMNQETNPQMVELQKQLIILGKKVKDKDEAEKTKRMIAELNAKAKIYVEEMKEKGENARFLVDQGFAATSLLGPEPPAPNQGPQGPEQVQ